MFGFALWLGGAIAFTMGLVVELQTNKLPPLVTLTARNRPVLFALLTVLAVVGWPFALMLRAVVYAPQAPLLYEEGTEVPISEYDDDDDDEEDDDQDNAWLDAPCATPGCGHLGSEHANHPDQADDHCGHPGCECNGFELETLDHGHTPVPDEPVTEPRHTPPSGFAPFAGAGDDPEAMRGLLGLGTHSHHALLEKALGHLQPEERTYMVPFSQVACAAFGDTIEVNARVQRACRINRLAVSSACAPFYVVHELEVGREPMLIEDAAVPASVFGLDSMFGQHLSYIVKPEQSIRLSVTATRPDPPRLGWRPSSWRRFVDYWSHSESWIYRGVRTPPVFQATLVCSVVGGPL